jgi:integrase
VDDELVRRNPCRIKNAGKEENDERPIATIVQVFELAAKVKSERRARVLLAGFTGLRLGELLALRRRHVDVLHDRLLITEATVELRKGQIITRDPRARPSARSTSTRSSPRP